MGDPSAPKDAGNVSDRDRTMMDGTHSSEGKPSVEKENDGGYRLRIREVGNGRISIAGPELGNAIMSYETGSGQTILKGDIVTFERSLGEGEMGKYTAIVYDLKYNRGNHEAEGAMISAFSEQDPLVPGWIRLHDIKHNISESMRDREKDLPDLDQRSTL